MKDISTYVQNRDGTVYRHLHADAVPHWHQYFRLVLFAKGLHQGWKTGVPAQQDRAVVLHKG